MDNIALKNSLLLFHLHLLINRDRLHKPKTDKINAIEQLTIYALALSRKLNLPLYYFKCAWLDGNNYYEFYPLHAVYEKEK